MNQLTSNQLTSGLNTDIHPKFQENGTYRFALNSVLETREGDHGTISNELGNTICATLPYATKIIGHAPTENEEIILFLFHRAAINPAHEIGVYNPLNCSYTTIGRSPLFNFSDQHPINAFVRIRNGCERVVYFTDFYNKYRVANLTDTSDWVTPNTVVVSDITKIEYSREYAHPKITLTTDALGEVVSLNSGGNVLIGTYNFVGRLIDAEGNTTNWLNITRPVAISDDNFDLLESASTYANYDGGSNLPNDIGYVPPTNKSISLDITNLDTRFKFYQIAVIKRTSTDGAITGVDILTKQAILGNSATFVYTGFNSQIETQTSLDEILSETVVINKVKAHTYIDNRLKLGHTVNPYINYTSFQRHASSIITNYVKVDSSDFKEKAKNPNYYFDKASFVADEVYALGIVYVFRDGSTSPVFHIPGRPPNDNVVGSHPHAIVTGDWDTFSIPFDNNVMDATKTKRWQVYNTATKFNTPEANQDVTGLMGYYEVDATYPQLDSECDAHPDGYWGRDTAGNLIVPNVTKIRHHRMPAHEMLNDSITTDQYKTGIMFIMDEDYPHEDIVGHFYTHADRTYEKTILDKGYVVPVKRDVDINVQANYAIWLTNKTGDTNILENVFFPVGTEQVYTYISPKTTVDESYSVGSYLRLEKYMTGESTRGTLSPTSERFEKVIFCHNMASAYSTSYTTLDKFNYEIEWSSFLKKTIPDSPANSVTAPNGRAIQNLSLNNNWLILYLTEVLPTYVNVGDPNFKFIQVSLKSDVDVFNNLFNINYRRIGNNVEVKETGVQLKTISYAGDTFVSLLNLVDFTYSRTSSGDVFASGDAISAPIESDIAFEFRHGDANTLGEDTYYRFNPEDPSPLIPLVEYLADKYYEPVRNESSYFYTEKYLLNKSFSYLDSINRYYPLPFDYEFCNECLTDHPYRIYYSELDNAEDSKDNLRVIRPNNYIDLPGITGNLNDLFNSFSKLYALTDMSPYLVPTRPQQLTTDENNVYIGTAEVFGIPPVQLKVTDYHFGGSSLFKSRCTTEYGTFYIDNFNGRPFMIDNQLTDLSLKGMRNFWQENGKLIFAAQFFQLTGQHYTNNSTMSETGVGYITTYDPRFKRIIVHKRDYRLISPLPIISQTTKPSNESIWYDGKWFYYVSPSNVANLITFDDAKFFECKSFTLSYSFITQSWVSFHSYMPYYLFNNYLSYYSNTFENDYIYTHLEGNHTQYYGTYYPHIIDFIAINNPNQEAQYHNVVYSSTSQVKDFMSEQYKNVPVTFNQGIFYNSKQSTGLKTIDIKTSPFQFDYDQDIILASKTDNKYNISNLRDIVINEDDPLWDSSWNALQTSPFNYIDKVPYQLNLDPTMSEFNKARLRDYYLGIRLIYNPDQDVKLNTDIITTRNANRTR